MSHSDALAAYTDLQSRRREIYRRVAALSTDVRRHRPSPDRWSPAEVLEHLLRHDRWVAEPLAIRKGGPSRSPFLALARGLAHGSFLVPAPRFLLPKGGLVFGEIAAASDALHARLARAVAAAEPGETIASVFPFGAMSAEQLCGGMAVHYGYHLRRLGEDVPETLDI